MSTPINWFFIAMIPYLTIIMTHSGQGTDRVKRALLTLATLSVLMGMPAMAVIQESCYLGRVTALDPLSHTLAIRAESVYSCDYSTGSPVCNFSPVTPLQVVGSVPDEDVYTVFHNNDQVVATVMGGSGGAWAGIALVSGGAGPGEWLSTEVFGDPGTLPVTLAGGYLVEYETLPDCSSCSGAVCKALSAHVMISSGGNRVHDVFLNPGQSTEYSGRNDGSLVSVLFQEGEAGSGKCPQAGTVAGVQPISNFIIHVVPPIGQQGTDVILTQPTAAGIEPKVTPQSTPSPTRTPAGYLLAIGGLCAAVLAMRGRSK